MRRFAEIILGLALAGLFLHYVVGVSSGLLAFLMITSAMFQFGLACFSNKKVD